MKRKKNKKILAFCALHGSDADNQHVYYGRGWSDR